MGGPHGLFTTRTSDHRPEAVSTFKRLSIGQYKPSKWSDDQYPNWSGSVLSGPTGAKRTKSFTASTHHATTKILEDDPNLILKKFWDLESKHRGRVCCPTIQRQGEV